MGLSKEGIVSSLQDLYGDSVTAADIRAWCAMNDVNYQTVTNKIADCKVSRGKWNLTIQEKLEQNYQGRLLRGCPQASTNRPLGR